MLTFNGGGRKVSEVSDGHFQDVSFLQLGVAGVVFANKRQNQALQMSEAVINTSSSSLLQQGFQSLEKKLRKTVILLHFTVKSVNIHSNNATACRVSLFLTFLSSLACFLWATVDLMGRGWLASVVMLGLILFAACCCALRGDTRCWSG